MANRIRSKDQAATRAEEAFKSTERRDTASKQITEAERAKTEVKTMKLRALRLAKEAADLQVKKPKKASRQPIRLKRKNGS